MPLIVNDVMRKILQNAPYDFTEDGVAAQEESKTSPEEVKFEFPAEKPWKKKKQQKKKKRKVYDLGQYTE